MADKRVIEEPSSTELYSDDWFLKDSATNGTTKILASKLKELLCGDYIADEWVAGETYTNGAIVSHEGKLYYNKSGGTLVHTTFNSNSWLEVKIDELLEKVIGSVGEKWRLVDTYHYDDLVVYGGRLYRCIKTASTQGTWVSNEWIEANAEYYFKKVREYIARYGFVPSREAVSSPYNKGDLILYRAPGDTTNSLYMRLNDTEYGDPTWIPENWLKVENIGGALSKIYDDIEESSCDVQIKEQSIIDENKVADLTSLAMVGSASGAIATFTDGSDLPMPKLEVAIEPQQDLHGYDAPWVGGAGKNKLPMTVDGIKAVNTYHSWSGNSTTINNVTITIETDSVGNVTGIRFNGTASADITFNLATNISIPNGEYKWSNDQIVNVSNLWLSLTNPNIAITLNAEKEKSVTISNSSIGSAYIYASSGNAFNNVIFKPMIRLASVTDATFAPYSNICPISGFTEANVVVSPTTDAEDGTTYNIQFKNGDNPLTVYGCSLDVISGELVVDRAYVDLGTLTWTHYSANRSYSSTIKTLIKAPSSQSSLGNYLAEKYKQIALSGTLVDGEFAVLQTGELIFYYDNVNEPTGQFVYELATPQTYQLTPTQVKSLLGTNNIWADTGAILDAEYTRDATTIINSLIARIEALENQ